MGLFNKAKENEIKKRNNSLRSVGYYGVIVALLVVSFAGLQLNASKYKKEVQVVSLKEEIGNQVITLDMIKALNLVEKNVTSDMVLWKDKDTVIDKYPTMQIRRNTPVYIDQLTNEQIIKHQYLYDLKPDEELLTFTYNNADAGGRIPRPGDRFRIRGSYRLEEGEDRNIFEGSKLSGNVYSDTIFDVVTVVDMLNRNGDSIYEIRREYEALPKTSQEALAKDETFKTSLSPSSLLVIVKTGQVKNYVNFQANAEAKYTLTVLSRDNQLMEDDIKTGESLIDIPVLEGGQ